MNNPTPITGTPNIALDIETLSTHNNAAIISIAAKVFNFSGKPVPYDKNKTTFYAIINASSCAMCGMHFDMETVNWWKRQSFEAKAPHNCLTLQSKLNISGALDQLKTFINDIRELSPSGNILIWCQGTDFDIPILKNAYTEILGWETPWRHTELRDSRTFIHGILGLIRPDVEDPYSLIPKNPKWKAHDALSDVDQLIWNVTHVAKILLP